MSPWFSNSAVTTDLLHEAGYRYVMDWTMDDQPVWLKTRGGSDPGNALPHRNQRQSRAGLISLYVRGFCEHDRRPVRRDAPTIHGPAEVCYKAVVHRPTQSKARTSTRRLRARPTTDALS